MSYSHDITYKAEYIADDMTSELRRELDDLITNALVCKMRSSDSAEEIKKIKNLLGYESEGHIGGYSE